MEWLNDLKALIFVRTTFKSEPSGLHDNYNNINKYNGGARLKFEKWRAVATKKNWRT